MAGCKIMVDEKVIEETGIKSDHVPATMPPTESTLEQLEAELRRCEQTEDYERAAEIQARIEKLKNEK